MNMTQDEMIAVMCGDFSSTPRDGYIHYREVLK